MDQLKNIYGFNSFCSSWLEIVSVCIQAVTGDTLKKVKPNFLKEKWLWIISCYLLFAALQSIWNKERFFTSVAVVQHAVGSFFVYYDVT